MSNVARWFPKQVLVTPSALTWAHGAATVERAAASARWLSAARVLDWT